MGSPAFIARPDPDGGYTGVHLQYDSSPPNMVPLILAAYRFRFGRDLEALSRYLVDDVVFAWEEIGTDLLDGAPPGLLQRLTGEVVSRQMDAHGPVISWNTDPRTHFSEAMALWVPGTPPPMSLPRDLPKLTPTPPAAPARTATRPPRR
ncbi:hypothetical protein [Streptomyces sp. NBC_00691]|uniref:hypothetical protein n=1 Tax=Streptomyces sp. NBC_00691 TaxID=2903671 RepID=UPI002E356ECE|nr:hypothetical protein [Streptomyces sp. NBC_00691]